MSYDDSQLASNPIYRIRFNLQDTDTTQEFLTDSEIAFILSKNSDDENKSTVEAARRILTRLTQFTREREGLVERYGDQFYRQWKDHLDELITELTNTTPGRVIVGGVVKTEVERVREDAESVYAPTVGINTFFDKSFR